MSEWIDSWSWQEAPNTRKCVLCGGDLVFWNSDIESSVHDNCGASCRFALDSLASNLCVAAFGQAMFNAGCVHGGIARYDHLGRPVRYYWRPNTRGHTAPGFDDGTSVSPSVEVPDTTSLVGSGGGLRTHNPSTASNTEAREAPETTGPIRSSCDIALQEMAWWEQGRATTPKDEQ